MLEISGSQVQALQELLASFPNVKKMSLRVNIAFVPRIRHPPSTGSLHNIAFHRLKSLRLQTEGALTSQDFISRQGSLIELDCSSQIWTLVTRVPKMKGLSIESSIGPLKAPLAGSFDSITILQLRHANSWTLQTSRQWTTILGEFPSLRCLVNSFEFHSKIEEIVEVTQDFLSGIRNNIVEFGTVIKYDWYSSLRTIYLYSETLVSLFQSVIESFSDRFCKGQHSFDLLSNDFASSFPPFI